MTRLCSIDGCTGRHFGRGWCQKHHARWLRHGDPNTNMLGASTRFYEDVVLAYQGDDCLLWPFFKNGSGYGYMCVNSKNRIVSRLACEAVYGQPPTPSHQAAHSCGNGNLGCVNPRHLRWATAKENQLDRIGHGTAVRGESVAGCKLTTADVLAIRADPRPATKLAPEYGVSDTAIRNARRKATWRHV